MKILFVTRWHWYVLAIATGTALLTLILAWRFPYGMNPDGQSYLDIADSWATFHIGNAINGYWSALLPLLMAPLRFLGFGNTVTFAVVGAFSAFLVVTLIFLIGRELEVHRWTLLAFCSVVGVRSAVWAIEVWTPDLLFAGAGLFVTFLGLRLGADANSSHWLLFGLALGGLYLAKPVGLLTGVAMGALIWLIWCGPKFKQENSKVLTRLGAMVLGWSAIPVSYIIALSIKYGFFTIGSSGAYNLALTDWTAWSSPTAVRLFHPPFDGATSAGTDPTYMDIQLPYSILSNEGIRLLLSNVNRNLEKLWDTQQSWVVITGLCILGSAVLVSQSKTFPTKEVIALGTVVIQTAVYLPVLFESRYLELSLLLLSVTFLGITSKLISKIRASSGVSIVAVVVLMFLLFPGTFTSSRHMDSPGQVVLKRIRDRHEHALMIQQIDANLELEKLDCSHVVSYAGEGKSNLSIVRTLSRSNGWFSSGNMQPEWGTQETIVQFRTYNVDCLIVWNNAQLPEGLEDSLTPLADTGDGWISVYRFSP